MDSDPGDLRARNSSKMMFENSIDDDHEAGLAYVREYVGGQLTAGVAPLEVLSSFGISNAPVGPYTEESMCRLILAQVHSVQDVELSRALACAARDGRLDEALQLLSAGAPWDAVDDAGHSAGAHALRGGHAALLDALLDEGSACVLREVDRAETGSTVGESAFKGSHADFLTQRLRFEADRLMDEQDPILSHQQGMMAYGGMMDEDALVERVETQGLLSSDLLPPSLLRRVGP